jgi:hypothetical protein
VRLIRVSGSGFTFILGSPCVLGEFRSHHSHGFFIRCRFCIQTSSVTFVPHSRTALTRPVRGEFDFFHHNLPANLQINAKWWADVRNDRSSVIVALSSEELPTLSFLYVFYASAILFGASALSSLSASVFVHTSACVCVVCVRVAFEKWLWNRRVEDAVLLSFLLFWAFSQLRKAAGITLETKGNWSSCSWWVLIHFEVWK